jgi:hypothetical protein
VETSIKVGTTKSEDGVSALDSPEHAGLFEARADHGSATSLDNTGANEQTLFAELGIVYTCRVGGEIVGFITEFLGEIGVSGLNLAKRSNELGDFAFVQPTFLMKPNPGVAAFGVGGIKQACQVPQVLAGVKQIDDLNGAGKVLAGQVPDPFRAIAQNDLLGGAAPAAFPSLDIKPPTERLGTFDGADVGGRSGVADRIAFRVALGLGTTQPNLASRVCADRPSIFPLQPAVSFFTTGTPVPSIWT